MGEVKHLDRAAIEAILPHRGRALMLDRAEVGEDTAIGYFVVTEEICEGHLPGLPIFRGTDRLEVLFLTMGVAVGTRLPKGKIPVAIKAEEVTWPGVVRVGQEVRAEVTIHRLRTKTATGSGTLYLGNDVVCAADKITGMIVDANDLR